MVFIRVVYTIYFYFLPNFYYIRGMPECDAKMYAFQDFVSPVQNQSFFVKSDQFGDRFLFCLPTKNEIVFPGDGRLKSIVFSIGEL